VALAWAEWEVSVGARLILQKVEAFAETKEGGGVGKGLSSRQKGFFGGKRLLDLDVHVFGSWNAHFLVRKGLWGAGNGLFLRGERTGSGEVVSSAGKWVL
jgi:hypothetical protein